MAYDFSDLTDTQLDVALWEANRDRDIQNRKIEALVLEAIRRREVYRTLAGGTGGSTDPGGSLPPEPQADHAGLELLEPDEYHVGWGHTIFHKTGDLLDVKRKRVMCSGQDAIHVQSQAGNGVSVELELIDNEIRQGPVTAHWGLCSNHVHGLIDGLDVRGVGLPAGDGEVRDGHGIYAKLMQVPGTGPDMNGSSLTVNRGTFVDLAGQAMQLVTRPHEGPVPDDFTVHIPEVYVENCSQLPSRGSSMLALYGAAKNGLRYELGTVVAVGTIGRAENPKAEASARGVIAAHADGFHHAHTVGFVESFRCQHLALDVVEGDRDPLIFADHRHIMFERIDGRLRGGVQCAASGVP